MIQALIGLNEKNEITIYASAFPLNKLGPMHSRGKNFPKTVYDLIEHQREADVIPALHALRDYYKEAPSRKIQPRAQAAESPVRQSEQPTLFRTKPKSKKRA